IPFPRILTTHLRYDSLPKSIFKNKAEIVVLFSNPKDTAVSFFHFHTNVPSVPSYSSWDEFFSKFLSGNSIVAVTDYHAVTWNKYTEDKNTMVIKYEDLKEVEQMLVKQIARFFGISPMAEQIQAIAERDTFQAVRDKA
ncbi:Sulfotransferase 6B1, partial [Acanthisitta chloris]